MLCSYYSLFSTMILSNLNRHYNFPCSKKNGAIIEILKNNPMKYRYLIGPTFVLEAANIKL